MAAIKTISEVDGHSSFLLNAMQREISDGVSSFHFEFLKNLSCPKLSCQESYYSSNLTTYAFGIHSGDAQKGTVYVWPETVAPKHPDTLLSCLDRHLSETEEENRKWCIYWADNTRSQNKNYTVVMYLENLVSTGARQRIDFKFFITGHSYGAVDRMAGCGENILRKESTIETPADYINLVNSKLNPNITWINMEQTNFKCYSKWLRTKYHEQRKDIHGQSFRFSEMVHFNFGIGERVDPTDGKVKTFRHPGVVWMRKTMNPREDPTLLDLKSTDDDTQLSSRTLKTLNRHPIKLSDKKCNDLRSLGKYLSPGANEYYRRIIGSQRRT